MTDLTIPAGMLTRALAIGALAALALAGCSGDSSGGEGADGAPLDLDGKTFTATEVTGWVPVTGTTIQLTFEDGRVSGQAGWSAVASKVATLCPPRSR